MIGSETDHGMDPVLGLSGPSLDPLVWRDMRRAAACSDPVIGLSDAMLSNHASNHTLPISTLPITVLGYIYRRDTGRIILSFICDGKHSKTPGNRSR